MAEFLYYLSLIRLFLLHDLSTALLMTVFVIIFLLNFRDRDREKDRGTEHTERDRDKERASDDLRSRVSRKRDENESERESKVRRCDTEHREIFAVKFNIKYGEQYEASQTTNNFAVQKLHMLLYPCHYFYFYYTHQDYSKFVCY